MPRWLYPRVLIDVFEPGSSPEPSSRRVDLGQLERREGATRMKSINECLATAAKAMLQPPSEKRPSSSRRSSGRDDGRASITDGRSTAAGSARSRGSRISSLRAAFEEKPRSVSPPESPMRFSTPETQSSMSFEKLAALEAENARLKEESEKEKQTRQEYQARCTSLEEQIGSLRTQLEQRDAHWRDEWEKKSQEMVRERSDAVHELQHIKSRASARETHNSGLQRQLTDLKRSISKSTRMESIVTSDTTFSQEMITLLYEIQNWVVNNFRKVKVNASPEHLCDRLVQAVDDRHAPSLRPVYGGWKSEYKVQILQATVVCLLMDVFSEPLLFGMPNHEIWVQALRMTAEQMSALLDPAQYSKWRATTLDLIRGSDAMIRNTGAAAKSMADTICEAISRIVETEISSTVSASLQNIVRRAITLAHLFRTQRASFDIQLPAPAKTFDPATMENASMEVDAQPGIPIQYSTFPLIVKFGDERGDNLQFRNVLLKASVLCSEP